MDRIRILYVTTTFPVYSETFLQREVRALRSLGAELHILSLHRGDSEFDGIEVDCFKKRELIRLTWLLPWLIVSRFPLFRKYVGALCSNRPRHWLNFWENLLGLGAAIVRESQVQKNRPDIIHCAWSSAPASFGWLLSRLVSLPFSVGAHAYDVFEKKGDWLLRPKIRDAAFIHTSTFAAAEELAKLVPSNKVHVIRRGMNEFPVFKTLRVSRECLRIICVARLVEKKGFPYQLDIYEDLSHSGVEFEARIVGEGEKGKSIQTEVNRRGLADKVKLLGKLSLEDTLAQIGWADVLFHTGIIAKNGDRDGLPNVIPEAMASGTLVVASPVSGVIEAIVGDVNGFLCEASDAASWTICCQRIQTDDSHCEKLRLNAREWVEREFTASRNSGRLLELLTQASA